MSGMYRQKVHKGMKGLAFGLSGWGICMSALEPTWNIVCGGL